MWFKIFLSHSLASPCVLYQDLCREKYFYEISLSIFPLMNILCLILIVFKEADMLTDELRKWELLTMQEQGETTDT